jgi:hypothetical protein
MRGTEQTGECSFNDGHAKSCPVVGPKLAVAPSDKTTPIRLATLCEII